MDTVCSAFSVNHINTNSTYTEMSNTAQSRFPSPDDQFATECSHTFTFHSRSLLHSCIPRSDRSAQDPCPNPWPHLTHLQVWPCVFPDSGLFQLASYSRLKCAGESSSHTSTERARSHGKEWGAGLKKIGQAAVSGSGAQLDKGIDSLPAFGSFPKTSYYEFHSFS